jgi:tetratricopeptide (TPR) repeat protein
MAVLLLMALLPCLAGAADTVAEGRNLLEQGRVDDAIATLQTKISGNPGDAQAHNLLCRSFMTLQDWDRAQAECEKAVSFDPNNGSYHLWLGRVYGEKADRSNFLAAASLAKKVRSEFETAVKLSPDDADARTDLAEFYLEAPGIIGGGKDKAQVQAGILARQDPLKAYWVEGRIAEKNKDYAGAEQNYRSGIEASKGSADAWLDLAIFYKHTNQLDKMEDAINHASTAQVRRPDVLVDAAEMLIRAGRNFPGAVQLLKKYLSNSTVEQAPAFKAHYLLGTVFEKQGDKQAAAAEYRTALSMARSFSAAQEALARLNR